MPRQLQLPGLPASKPPARRLTAKRDLSAAELARAMARNAITPADMASIPPGARSRRWLLAKLLRSRKGA